MSWHDGGAVPPNQPHQPWAPLFPHATPTENSAVPLHDALLSMWSDITGGEYESSQDAQPGAATQAPNSSTEDLPNSEESNDDDGSEAEDSRSDGDEGYVSDTLQVVNSQDETQGRATSPSAPIIDPDLLSAVHPNPASQNFAPPNAGSEAAPQQQSDWLGPPVDGAAFAGLEPLQAGFFQKGPGPVFRDGIRHYPFLNLHIAAPPPLPPNVPPKGLMAAVRRPRPDMTINGWIVTKHPRPPLDDPVQSQTQQAPAYQPPIQSIQENAQVQQQEQQHMQHAESPTRGYVQGRTTHAMPGAGSDSESTRHVAESRGVPTGKPLADRMQVYGIHAEPSTIRRSGRLKARALVDPDKQRQEDSEDIDQLLDAYLAAEEFAHASTSVSPDWTSGNLPTSAVKSEKPATAAASTKGKAKEKVVDVTPDGQKIYYLCGLPREPGSNRVCDAIFSDHNSHERHMTCHHAVREMELCEESGASPSTLIFGGRHIETSAGCEFCGKTFSRPDALTRHRKEKHPRETHPEGTGTAEIDRPRRNATKLHYSTLAAEHLRIDTDVLAPEGNVLRPYRVTALTKTTKGSKGLHLAQLLHVEQWAWNRYRYGTACGFKRTNIYPVLEAETGGIPFYTPSGEENLYEGAVVADKIPKNGPLRKGKDGGTFFQLDIEPLQRKRVRDPSEEEIGDSSGDRSAKRNRSS